MIVPYQYTDARAMSEDGYAVVDKSGRYGYVDSQGNILLKPQFKEVRDFQNGYAVVYLEKNQLIKFENNKLSKYRIAYLLRYIRGYVVTVISFLMPAIFLIMAAFFIKNYVIPKKHYYSYVDEPQDTETT